MLSPSPKRGRPAVVSTEEVVVSALSVIDRVGIDSLTMRSLAASMGISPMTLYRHVADKQALLALIPDALLAGVCAEVRRKRTALTALQAVADGLGSTLNHHPGVAHLFEQPTPGPNMNAAADHVIGLLVAEGLSAYEARTALRAVVAQVIGEAITMHGRFDMGGVRLLLDGVRTRLAGHK